ncbi:ATP-grasp domain-containing protein [Flaviramulus aquimarinus]|uniref:ATP-grasp domain-containing protein n=2 Tax=Flaviramulus aquimarinus TaxID=1170456 RepID=A0ABP9FJG9_9FLAO
MSSLKYSPIKYSIYIKNYSYFPNLNSDIQWVNCIDSEVKRFNIDLVMPVDEYGIRLTIKNKALFSCAEKLCIIPSIKNFDIANNKGVLSKHMHKNQIKCSKGIIVKAGNILKETLINFPVIIKPVEGFGGGRGMQKFETRQSVEDFFLMNTFNYDYLIEEYIEGYDLGVNVLCEKGTILAYTMQKGNLFHDQPFKPQIGLDFLYEPELYIEVKKLVKSLNWSGVANIDVRYDKNKKAYKILEINPRFWYTLDASLCAGVNFPYLYCLSSLGVNYNIPNYKCISYLNLNGLLKTFKGNKRFIFRIKYLFNNTILKFLLRDPLVLGYRIFNSIGNRLKNK